MKFPLNGRKSVANSSKIAQSLSIKTHQEKPRRGVWPQSNCCCCCRWWCCWYCCCSSCCCYCCCWVCAFGKRDLAIVIDTDAHYAGSGCVSFTATSTRHRVLRPVPRVPFVGAANQPPEATIANWAPFGSATAAAGTTTTRVMAKKNLIICFHLSAPEAGINKGGQQRLCACLRTFPMQFRCTTQSITAAHESMQQSLANGAALLFSHCSFDEHEHSGSGSGYSSSFAVLCCCRCCGLRLCWGCTPENDHN